MTIRIRLARGGKNKSPYYRIVVADKRSPRDGKFIERVGSYVPSNKNKKTTIELERIQYWLGTGAQPSDTVRSLLTLHGFKFNQDGKLESVSPVAEIAPKEHKPKKSKKAVAAEKAAAEAKLAGAKEPAPEGGAETQA